MDITSARNSPIPMVFSKYAEHVGFLSRGIYTSLSFLSSFIIMPKKCLPSLEGANKKSVLVRS